MHRLHGSATSTDVQCVNRNKHTCPFTARQLNPTTYLIREHDNYGEFPHIYAKLCSTIDLAGCERSVWVITDTGVGTTVSNRGRSPEPDLWTIASFLEGTINPGNRIPYVVISSHCHFDHILGLKHLVLQPTGSCSAKKLAKTTVVASSYDHSFLQPWKVLNFNSLCEEQNISAPHYPIEIWAEDQARLTYRHSSGFDMDLGIITFHTPGHTPDSLTWYDTEERTIYVGDSLYEQESAETRNAAWGREKPAPIIFTPEGNIKDWLKSIDKLVHFVEYQNLQHPQKPVKLAAGHVTADAVAQETLLEVRNFMKRVLAGEVQQLPADDIRGEPRGYWAEDRPGQPGGSVGRFSMVAPLRIIEEGRASLCKTADC